MVADAVGQDPILDAIGGLVDGMVVGYVVIANFLGGDGASRVYVDSMENQRCHETLGLLAYGWAIENRRAADSADD